MQMGRCFIKVHHGVEHIKVRVSLLKIFHVFFQTGNSNFRIGSADTRIIFRADLHQVLIETFLLVCTRDNRLARLTIEQVLKVVRNLSVIPLLFCIIVSYHTVKKLVIRFAQILLFEDDIIGRSGWVDILGSELSVVVRQAAFALAH